MVGMHKEVWRRTTMENKDVHKSKVGKYSLNILLDLLSISKLLVVPFKVRLFLGKDKEDQHVQTLKHITSISFASHSKKCEQ